MLGKIRGQIRTISGMFGYLRNAYRASLGPPAYKVLFPNAIVEDQVRLWYDDASDIELGEGVYVSSFTVLSTLSNHGKRNSKLIVGAGTYIGELNNIRASGGQITIGKKCLISQQVSLIGSGHLYARGEWIQDQPWDETKNFITIGDDVWIGCGAIVLPGVTIGDGAVIAAGTIVTKDVPAQTIVAGIPARFVKERE
jgi:acetyltransferase-like isoleucine patch superfamily enzyme